MIGKSRINLIAILIVINFLIDLVTCIKFVAIFLKYTYGFKLRLYYIYIVVIQIICNIVTIIALVFNDWYFVGFISLLNMFLNAIKIFLLFWIYKKYHESNESISDTQSLTLKY